MAENEIVEATETTQVKATETVETAEKPSLGTRFVGGVKEWFRKFTVKLKRRPMNIAFFVLVVSSLVYLLLLGNFSQTGEEYAGNFAICMFVNTLFCILVLLLFMYSFPKREKKPKIVMLVLLFAFMAVMIALDILLYIKWSAAWESALELFKGQGEAGALKIEAREKYIYGAIYGMLAHAILVAIAAALTATYPLYGKLINKINTRKVIESTEIKGEIDTAEEV